MMTWRLFIAIVVAAVSLALTKHFFGATPELPAPDHQGRQVNYDSLYPEAADAALRAREQR